MVTSGSKTKRVLKTKRNGLLSLIFSENFAKKFYLLNLCFLFQKFCDLAQVFFVILLTVYLCDCVNYQVLFTNKVPGHSLGEKVHLSDVFETSPAQCIAKFSFKVGPNKSQR